MSGELVAVVEDEPDILTCIRYQLCASGYRVVVARDGREGLETIRREAPHLVLLDRMLPDWDGIELFRRLQDDPLTSAIPVVMVTAMGDEKDVVAALRLGAEDYIRKPFRIGELIARVATVLRRRRPHPVEARERRLALGALTIDPVRHEVRVGDEVIALTATEFRLLQALARHPGRVFTRAELLDRAIGDDVDVIDRNVDVHVLAVRRKLGGHRDLVQTVRGVGYTLRAEKD